MKNFLITWWIVHSNEVIRCLKGLSLGKSCRRGCITLLTSQPVFMHEQETFASMCLSGMYQLTPFSSMFFALSTHKGRSHLPKRSYQVIHPSSLQHGVIQYVFTIPCSKQIPGSPPLAETRVMVQAISCRGNYLPGDEGEIHPQKISSREQKTF